MLTLISLVLIIPLSLWRGYALSVLWAWHVSPVFGITEISVAQGWGISVLVGLLTYQMDADDENSDDYQIKALVISAILPVFALFSGWMATWFL